MSQTLPSDTDADHNPVDQLAYITEQLAKALTGLTYSLQDDALSLALLDGLEQLGRRVDGARVASTAEVARRADVELYGGTASLSKRMGCTGKLDLIMSVTHVSVREVKRRISLGALTSARPGVGQLRPAVFPTVSAALAAGEIGVDSAEIIVKGLQEVIRQADPSDLHLAERVLVANATGALNDDTAGLPGAGIALPADRMRVLVHEWQARLDPDGIAPQEEAREAKSSISFGSFERGLYRIFGGVTPDLRGEFETYFASRLSARATVKFLPTAGPAELDGAEGADVVPDTELAGSDGAEVVPDAEVVDIDRRPGGEKRADILRDMVREAARDPKAGVMGGSAPTVTVHVNAVDLNAGRGVGWIDGVEAPVSLTTVDQALCSGGFIPILFGPNNEVLRVGDKRRAFSPAMTKAIMSRDGGCIISGCDIPAYWTELHHVKSYAQGGKTEVANGVCLCYRHHHAIDTSGWQIRMTHGRPEVLGPAWIDPSQTWRPAQNHRANRAVS
ncbi:HNH endonuclease [Cryobacterium frigoriphilum]|uniref:HNH endonuclease n=1 Tax=Cryobacterium frigoriphilum TaxID=1259150 RepID=A0A4R8ZVB6_9MICO|nr:HNH endonuclease signature motif containing protein [Cryobacterium frigoriphilum]TFD46999.1 HNH endonuclease [Cryobacterium frigoriphilum]